MVDIQTQLRFWFDAISLDDRLKIYNRYIQDKQNSIIADSVVNNILNESNTPHCSQEEFYRRNVNIDNN